MCFSSLTAQNINSKAFFSCEVLAIGPEFVTGTIDNTLKPGIRVNLFTTHISSYKSPHFYSGIDFSISTHMFDPTVQERDIMDLYSVVTTTTSQFGTTQTSEPIEDIQISRMSVGIPIGYQGLNLDQKISFLMNITPMYYSFGNSLQGDDYDITDSGFGISFKIGFDYHWDKGMYLRLSYTHGSIPGFELPILEELRSISGPGTYGNLQIGLVLTTLERDFLPQ